jgi:hypothetical protein
VTPQAFGLFLEKEYQMVDPTFHDSAAREMLGRCGAYCGVCEWREPSRCPGCQANQGKMFWGQCAVATCSIEKGYPHCGYCKALPCPTLLAAFNNPEHGDNGERLANLKGWANGQTTFLKLTKIKPASQ